MLKLIIGDQRFGFYAGFIVVYSVNGILQYMGDLFCIINTKPYQGKYPQIGIHQLVR